MGFVFLRHSESNDGLSYECTYDCGNSCAREIFWWFLRKKKMDTFGAFRCLGSQWASASSGHVLSRCGLVQKFRSIKV